MNLTVPTLEVQMECYEGPLAVLVTLIKRNKLSIWDIPLSSLTERFLEYVDVVQEMNLKIAEDFIDMASLLIFLKSKLLLPLENGHGEETGQDELIERIIEFERIRSMAENIGSLPVLYRDTFCRGTKRLEGEEDYDLLGLCVAFFELIARKEERFIVVREIRPTLEEKIEMLRSILDSLGEYVWDMRDGEGHNEKVATILGILELTRQRQVTLYQRRPFGRIVVKKRMAADSGAPYRAPADYAAN